MYINYELEDGVGILKINRPEALNALNSSVLEELDELLEKIKKDPEIKVLIVTGEGKAFVAGADIKEMSTLLPEEAREFAILGQGVFLKLQNLEIPTIAAINGFALGGGLELAMSCDLRFISQKAKVGQPETGLGITPGFGGTQRLQRLVGLAKAKELIFRANMIKGDEAKEIGLVNEVVEEDVLEYSLKIADEIKSKSISAIKYSKKAINMGADVSIEQGNDIESMLFGLCFSFEDQKNRMNAFLKK